MATIDINNVELNYFEFGEGPPFILVHGSASDYRTWNNQETFFAERYRTIAYSRRYHWPNSPIPDTAEYAMNEHVEDLRTLITALGKGPVHLAGHSYGALLCLLLAMRTPGLVRSLVLSEPPAITLFVSNTPTPTEILKLLLSHPRTAAAIIRFGVTGLVPARRAINRGEMAKGVRLFGDAVFGPGGYDRFSEFRKSQVADNLSTIKAELLGPGFLPLDPRQVAKVDVPALLVNGEQSIPLFRLLSDRLEELLPQAKRTFIPAASHAMHEDNPEMFNEQVLRFLRMQPNIA